MLVRSEMAQNKVIKFYNTYGFICVLLLDFYTALVEWGLKMVSFCQPN